MDTFLKLKLTVSPFEFCSKPGDISQQVLVMTLNGADITIDSVWPFEINQNHQFIDILEDQQQGVNWYQ